MYVMHNNNARHRVVREPTTAITPDNPHFTNSGRMYWNADTLFNTFWEDVEELDRVAELIPQSLTQLSRVNKELSKERLESLDNRYTEEALKRFKEESEWDTIVNRIWI